MRYPSRFGHSVSSVVIALGLYSAILGSSCSPAVKTIQITNTTPEVGSTIVYDSIETSDSTITMKGLGFGVPMDLHGVEEIRQRIRILEKNEIVPTRLEVYYEKAMLTQQNFFREKTIEYPVQGKTYIVQAADDGIDVVNADGETPGEEEIGIIKRFFDNLGTLSPLDEAMAAGPLAIGQSIVLSSEQVAELYEETVEAADFTFTLREVQGDLAWFDQSVTFTHTFENDLIGQSNLSGEVCVLINGNWPVSTRLAGPMTVAGESEESGVVFSLEGQGREEIDITLTYIEPGEQE